MSSRVDDRIFKTLTRSSDKHTSRLLHDLVTAVLLFGPMVLSAAAVGGLSRSSTSSSLWAGSSGPPSRPCSTSCWLVGVLALSAGLCRQIGARHPKPRRFVFEPGVERDPQDMRGITLALMSYRRFVMVNSLPFASLLAQLPSFDRLVLRAYSPSVHMGANVSNKLNSSIPI